MKITRIRVPGFRALHNVDLSFDQELSPQVFPLGSQNGGGKSTLLQLVFALLKALEGHQSPGAAMVKNILSSHKFSSKDHTPETLCEIELFLNGAQVSLGFELHQRVPNSPLKNVKIDSSRGFSELFKSLEPDKKKLSRLSSQMSKLEKLGKALNEAIDDFLDVYDGQNLEEKIEEKFRKKLADFKADKELITLVERLIAGSDNMGNFRESLRSRYAEMQDTHNLLSSELARDEINSNSVTKWLKTSKQIYLCQSEYTENLGNAFALFCSFEGLESINELTTISHSIYLAAPVTHMFLFLSKDAKERVFQAQRNAGGMRGYLSSLDSLKKECSGLFTYDFLSVEILLEIIRDARDRDFENAVNSGYYGEKYHQVIAAMNALLSGKQIRVSSDLSGIYFTAGEKDSRIKLLPEDLSHGELKRLSTYAWLKYQVNGDAVVLMDEVEIALHPDWQYQVVTDLVAWGAKNQYILATHSYELCEALTPAHVKELEPKLQQKKSTVA